MLYALLAMGVLIIYLLISLWWLRYDVKDIKETSLWFLESRLERKILKAKIEMKRLFDSKDHARSEIKLGGTKKIKIDFANLKCPKGFTEKVMEKIREVKENDKRKGN